MLHQLLEQLPSEVQVGRVRLVRLWPFAQRRTRGNAAVAVELNTGNEPDLISFLDSYWNDTVLSLRGRIQSSRHNDREQFPADPGMVWFSEDTTDSVLYNNGLTTEISIDELPIATASWGGFGRIGATLAVHWPAETVTYEAIAWRNENSSGPRLLDETAVKKVDEMKDTFLCRDSRLGTTMLAPRGNSPVLFGIRTWTIEAAEIAVQALISGRNTEPVNAWRIFETNQATNDHLQELFEVKVESIEILKGGHVVIQSRNERFLAFKESGLICKVVQSLSIGDMIECKGLPAPDGSVHIEFIRILDLVPQKRRPVCTTCDKAMTSMGVGQGVRCKKCGHVSEEAWIYSERNIEHRQWIQPPPSYRRHLAKPLDEDPTQQNNL